MRIDSYAQVQQLYQTKKTQQTQKTNRPSFSDKLQISSAGKDMQTAKAAVAQAPDVRSDVIASLKARIQNGTYDVSGESFAEKIMERYYAASNM